jgi:hypothetical protein
VGEVLDQVGEGVRLEDGSVGAGLELRCAGRPFCLFGGVPADRRRIHVARSPCCLFCIPRPALVGGHDECGGIGHALLCRQAGGGRDSELREGAREEPVHRHVAGCIDRGRSEAGLVVGPEARRVLVIGFDVRGLRRWRQAGKRLVCRRAVGRLGRAPGQLDQSFPVDLVRRRHS